MKWFEYKCFVVCRLQRYIDEAGKVKVIEVNFASKSRSYTHKFSAMVITYLQTIKVQKTVVELLNTTGYIVRNIMEDAFEQASETRRFIDKFKHVILYEKANSPDYEHTTTLIDKDKDCLFNLVEGRKEKSGKVLFFELNEKEKQPQIEIVNMNMWKV